MKKRFFLLSFLAIFTVALFVFWPNGDLKADDRSIFSASTKPYVMLILDNSGSMTDNTPGHDGYDFVVKKEDCNTFKTYTTSTGKTYEFSTTATTSKNGYTTRIEALKRVTIQLLDEFRDKVKMGFANYFYNPDVNYTERIRRDRWSPYYLHATTWTGTSNPDGAVIRKGITDLSTDSDPVIDALHDAELDAICDAVKEFVAAGHTPLAESLDTIYGYYKDDGSGNCKISETDGNSWTDYLGYTRIPADTVPPPQYSCQQNYIIMVTDGEPTHDDFGASNPVNDYYSNCSGCYNVVATPSNYSHPYTLASLFDNNNNGFQDVLDVTEWMFDNPLVSGQIAGGIRTWAVGMRLGATSENNLKTAVANAGGTYLAGNDYASLSSGLLSALEAINLSSFAFSSYTSPKKITTGTDNTYVSYSGYFLNKELGTPIWEGHLKCLKIVSSPAYAFEEQWDSFQQMFNQGENARVLSTAVPNQYSGTKFTYTPLNFKSTTTNPNDWKQSLNVTTDAQVATTINYIRGDATTRNVATATSSLFLLGDIFHSDVIYVGKPMQWKWIYNTSACSSTASTTSDTSCFQKFYADKKDRQKVVYTGTNDGVIHTINADISGGGAEISGFIPDEVLHSLKTIAIDKGYTYTADGRMTSADIYSPTSDEWQTILAFGLREGGKFYYCRNVSLPASQTTKWKFPEYVAAATITAINTTTKIITVGTVTGTFAANQILVNERRTARTTLSLVSGTSLTVANTNNLAVGNRVYALPAYAKYVGETWGKPLIGRFKIKKGAGSESAIWGVLLTGGYGVGGTDPEGKALFFVDADTGALLWYLAYASANSVTDDHYESTSADLNFPIPQSITAVDLNNDTYVDTVYFGNTGGNLFKLDISDPDPETWIPELLFRGTTTSAQPIFLPASISYDQCYKLWLHFGTGDRNDPQNAPTGQFIAIMDDTSVTYPLTATTTVLQKLTWTLGTAPAPDTASTTSNTAKDGWYFDFLDDKETIFDPDPFIIPDGNVPTLFFNTYQPKTTKIDTDPCGSGGNMHLYTIRLPYCATNPGSLSGTRDDSRIAGGGMLDDAYLLYENTASTGSITNKKFDEFTLQYPGGVFYFKEIVR